MHCFHFKITIFLKIVSSSRRRFVASRYTPRVHVSVEFSFRKKQTARLLNATLLRTSKIRGSWNMKKSLCGSGWFLKRVPRSETKMWSEVHLDVYEESHHCKTCWTCGFSSFILTKLMTRSIISSSTCFIFSPHSCFFMHSQLDALQENSCSDPGAPLLTDSGLAR